MLNLNKNSDFDSDDLSESDDGLPVSGFNPAGDAEEDLDEESDDDLVDEDENDEEAEESELEPIIADILRAKESFSDETDDEDDELEEEAEDSGCDSVLVSKSKIILAKQLIENIRENGARLSALFGGLLDDGDEDRIAIAEISDGLIEATEDDGSVVEGIFNGENMIGPDGKEYSVPANYASKSKLVEGDILKLTITDRGTFIYKQTKPIERRRVIGKLEKDSNGNYFVSAERKKFRVITASVTYYKGVPGDQVVILLPVAGDSLWAAVENVIKNK